jgi:hypothetical protein
LKSSVSHGWQNSIPLPRARALTSHLLNVHAGHDDVMSFTDCGWGMFILTGSLRDKVCLEATLYRATI